MGMHLKALQCPKRLSLVSNFQNTFYNFLFSWLAACLLPLDSQLIISQLIITQKKKNWIDFNKHLTPKKIKKKNSQMEVSSWSRISLWLCLETSVLHVLACSHAIFLFSFCTNPLSKGIRIFFSFLFFLSWILHKAPLKRCWRILKGVALVSSLFFFPLFGALSKIKLIYICLVCGAKYAYRIQYLYILLFFFFFLFPQKFLLPRNVATTSHKMYLSFK